MPHFRTSAQCDCPLKAEMPCTLAELSGLTQVTDLGHDVETLALLGTQFEDALVTTRNSGAFLTARGGYAPLQTCAMPLRISNRRISLRVASDSVLSLARSWRDTNADLPGSLVAYSPDGIIHHRVQYVTGYDERVAESLESLPIARVQSANGLDPGGDNIISLNAVRQTRESWTQADAGMHLNDILIGRGLRRHRCLPNVGRERAWRVRPEMLDSFVRFLNQRRTRFVRIVPGEDIAQIDTGVVENTSMLGSVLIMQTATATCALDRDAIATAWVIASPQCWQLEIYDRTARSMAVFAADPWTSGALWSDLLVSLPRWG